MLTLCRPTLRAPQNQPRAVDNPDFGALFDSWVNSIQWFDPNSVNWVSVLSSPQAPSSTDQQQDVWENIAGIDSRVQTHSLE